MTEEEIFNSLCDIIATLDRLTDEVFEKDCYDTANEIDLIAEQINDALRTFQEEIQQ